jgi:hypothetical protein
VRPSFQRSKSKWRTALHKSLRLHAPGGESKCVTATGHNFTSQFAGVTRHSDRLWPKRTEAPIQKDRIGPLSCERNTRPLSPDEHSCTKKKKCKRLVDICFLVWYIVWASSSWHPSTGCFDRQPENAIKKGLMEGGWLNRKEVTP